MVTKWTFGDHSLKKRMIHFGCIVGTCIRLGWNFFVPPKKER